MCQLLTESEERGGDREMAVKASGERQPALVLEFDLLLLMLLIFLDTVTRRKIHLSQRPCHTP